MSKTTKKKIAVGSKALLTIRTESDLRKLNRLFELFKSGDLPELGNIIIHAYKYTRAGGVPPTYFNRSTRYAVGRTNRVKNANICPHVSCGAGINVATRDWCVDSGGLKYKNKKELYLMEFRVHDIAAIPQERIQFGFRAGEIKFEGKFRLFRSLTVKKLSTKIRKR